MFENAPTCVQQYEFLRTTKIFTSRRNSKIALFVLKLSNRVPFENRPNAAVFILEKSRATSLTAKSTSKGAICSLKISRCLMKNKLPLIAPYNRYKYAIIDKGYEI